VAVPTSVAVAVPTSVAVAVPTSVDIPAEAELDAELDDLISPAVGTGGLHVKDDDLLAPHWSSSLVRGDDKFASIPESRSILGIVGDSATPLVGRARAIAIAVRQERR